MTSYVRERAGAALLSLDGGGVKGISSLMILQRIMDRVREIEGRDMKDERKPRDYFDLAGGTSTGGLAALMLFRLNMTTSEVIGHYRRLSAQVFAPTIAGFEIHKLGTLGYWIGNGYLGLKKVLGKPGFSGTRLVAAIDKVTNGGAPLRDASGTSGKMLICATVADKGETVLFRSYPLPKDSEPQSETAKLVDHDKISIREACRATSAAPTYLPAMDIPDKNGHMIKFWDGGLLNNNPVDQVWDARYDLPAARETDPQTNVERYIEPVVTCVVSIGTSFYSPTLPDDGTDLPNILKKTVGFATNTQAKHWDFMGNNIRRNRRLPVEHQTKYFRYNAPARQEYHLDDYQSMPKLETDTANYLATFGPIPAEANLDSEEFENHIEVCARALAKTKLDPEGDEPNGHAQNGNA